MHECHQPRTDRPSPFLDGDPERERHRPAAERRTFLKVAGAAGAGLLLSAAPGAERAAAATTKRAYVVVIDGCRPDEIDSGLMPNVKALRDSGRNFARARSLPITETIPNHVMMMTGLRPDRTGVPANAVWDRTLGAERTLELPTDLKRETLLARGARQRLRTASVLSKDYLYGIFGRQATYRWEPSPILPVTGHAPDGFTMDATIEMIDQYDPHLTFVNLGDIDRAGHSDVTGGLGLQLARRLALLSTDRQVQRLVSHLQETRRWSTSLVLVLADHSMDWSLPHRVISLQPALNADPTLVGNFAISQNGGADLVYWIGSPARRAAGVRRILEIVRTQRGVLAAHDRAATPSLRLGPEAGDVVAYCQAGWRFSDPFVVNNPIPGNHGHPTTEPIPFFIAGGHPSVRRGTSSVLAHTVDVAPTVGEMLGVPADPNHPYDGRSLLRA
ncbi:alkaline phosphatase family protein [Nocardioides zeae]|uniref:Alkaline phosphatase family protein n=1 Tax=Nocardioides imazamoxiresistens TaxID=3231893 RepID=A0ABU3PWU9_9ACTN|nr:alkaline phosphatase family protein [Nocardioides zeae]MDT9593674.1 alkaline phosphatase family protein [Nocardioides zeae]